MGMPELEIYSMIGAEGFAIWVSVALGRATRWSATRKTVHLRRGRRNSVA